MKAILKKVKGQKWDGGVYVKLVGIWRPLLKFQKLEVSKNKESSLNLVNLIGGSVRADG